MKKKVSALLSIMMAIVIMGAFTACGAKYDAVDEEDLSRWIVRFTSEYPSDLPPEGVEYSLQALEEMQVQGNAFTIQIPYDAVYGQMAHEDKNFTLEPKTEFFYIDDNGRQTELSNLRLEKDYYFMRHLLYEYDESRDEWQHSQRIFYQGTYRLHYAFGTELNTAGLPTAAIAGFFIKIIVQ